MMMSSGGKWTCVSKFLRTWFWFLKHIGYNLCVVQMTTLFICVADVCFCVCLSRVMLRKDCFYHYQHFSFRVTPGSLISKLFVCVGVCVCGMHMCVCQGVVCPRQDLRGFQWEEALTLLNPSYFNPAANDLCLFSSPCTSCFTQHDISQKILHYTRKTENLCDNDLTVKTHCANFFFFNGEHIESYTNADESRTALFWLRGCEREFCLFLRWCNCSILCS